MDTQATVTIDRVFELAGLPIPQNQELQSNHSEKCLELRPCSVLLKDGKWIRARWHQGDQGAGFELRYNYDLYPQLVIDAFLELPSGTNDDGTPYKWSPPTKASV